MNETQEIQDSTAQEINRGCCKKPLSAHRLAADDIPLSAVVQCLQVEQSVLKCFSDGMLSWLPVRDLPLAYLPLKVGGVQD